jgi:hypothetical protein
MGGFEKARFRGLRLLKLAISFLRFPFSEKHDSLAASEKNDAFEEARNDGFEGSPQPSHRTLDGNDVKAPLSRWGMNCGD